MENYSRKKLELESTIRPGESPNKKYLTLFSSLNQALHHKLLQCREYLKEQAE